MKKQLTLHLVLVFIFCRECLAGGVLLVKKGTALCEAPESISLVQSYSPEKASETDNRKIIQLAEACPQLNISPTLLADANRVSSEARYATLAQSFQENKSTSWEALVASGKAAGRSEAQIRQTMQAFLKTEKDACQYHDQRKKLPPVRNQFQTSWCQSFAAAAMASFALKKDISAEAVAANNQLEGNGNWSGGGEIKQAFDTSEKNGFCLTSEVPQVEEVVKSGAMDNMSSIDEINKLVEKQKRSALTAGNSDCGDLNTFAVKYSKRYGLDPAQFAAVLSQASDRNAVKKYFNGKCSSTEKTNLQIKGVNVVVPGEAEHYPAYDDKSKYDQANPAAAKKMLQDALNGDQVVGLAATRILGTRGGHAVVIVGQQWSEKLQQCRVIIRNSYGSKDCQGNLAAGEECDGQGNYYAPYSSVLKHLNTLYFMQGNSAAKN